MFKIVFIWLGLGLGQVCLFTCSAFSRATAGGPVFLVTHPAISLAILPPRKKWIRRGCILGKCRAKFKTKTKLGNMTEMKHIK